MSQSGPSDNIAPGAGEVSASGKPISRLAKFCCMDIEGAPTSRPPCMIVSKPLAVVSPAFRLENLKAKSKSTQSSQ